MDQAGRISSEAFVNVSSTMLSACGNKQHCDRRSSYKNSHLVRETTCTPGISFTQQREFWGGDPACWAIRKLLRGDVPLNSSSALFLFQLLGWQDMPLSSTTGEFMGGRGSQMPPAPFSSDLGWLMSSAAHP